MLERSCYGAGNYTLDQIISEPIVYRKPSGATVCNASNAGVKESFLVEGTASAEIARYRHLPETGHDVQLVLPSLWGSYDHRCAPAGGLGTFPVTVVERERIASRIGVTAAVRAYIAGAAR